MHGDGSLGWREHAPYDAHRRCRGRPTVPEALLDQLAIGGGS
jgi:protein-L-isoaspartate(D-aspartate) O-methyltransferase